jgi:hypothetical protein
VKLRITCKTLDHISVSNLTEFQGDLKSLSQENFVKLRKSFEVNGFSAPVFVWQSGKKNFILDGHQRVRAVKRLMEVERWEVPDLPVVMIEAKSKTEAKRKLLHFCSEYGTMETDGLYQFIHDSGINFEELSADFNLRQIDLPSFDLEFFSEPVNLGEDADPGETSAKERLVVCPACHHEFPA